MTNNSLKKPIHLLKKVEQKSNLRVVDYSKCLNEKQLYMLKVTRSIYSPDIKESKDVSLVFCLTRLSAILTSKYTNQVQIFPRWKLWCLCKGIENYHYHPVQNVQKKNSMAFSNLVYKFWHCIMNHRLFLSWQAQK